MSVLGFQHVMSVDIRRAEVSPARTVKQVAQEVTQSLRTTAGHDGKVSGIFAHAHFATVRKHRAHAKSLLRLLQWPVYAVNFLLPTP